MKYNPFQITMLLTCCMLCLTACGSDSAFEPEPDRGVEMRFDVASESRAMTTVLKEFSVYGDIKAQSSVIDPIVMFNKTVVTNRDGAWSYDGTQYWMPKYEHSFVAISPSVSLESNAAPQYRGSTLSFNYTMPTFSGKEMQDTQDKSEITDIVAATHRRLYDEGGNSDVISLKFGHLLSMLNFAPTLNDKSLKSDDCIQFYKVEIIGLKNKAKIAVTPAQLLKNSLTDDCLIEMSGYDGNDKLTINFTTPKIVQNGQQINLFADTDALVMLPQAFGASSDAAVRFTYSFLNEPDNKIQGSIALRGFEWKPGTAYTYSFTVDKVGLNLGTVTIKAWDTMSIPTIYWPIE